MKTMNTIPQIDTMSKPQRAVVDIIASAYESAIVDATYAIWFRENHPDKWEDGYDELLAKKKGAEEALGHLLQSLGMDDNELDAIWERADREWKYDEAEFQMYK